jgi:hypothetical protein
VGGNGLILTTEGPGEHETNVIIGNEFEIRLMITLISDRAGRRAAVRLP